MPGPSEMAGGWGRVGKNPCFRGGCVILDFGVESDLSKFIDAIWRYKPMLIVLVVGGLIVFVFCVIDTHRHRKKTRKQRPPHKDH
jgi:hypothetical protein